MDLLKRRFQVSLYPSRVDFTWPKRRLLCIYFISFTGYAGYIPAVSSENVYGVTYSKATQASAEQTIHKGMDQPANIKFKSTANAEFQHRHSD